MPKSRWKQRVVVLLVVTTLALAGSLSILSYDLAFGNRTNNHGPAEAPCGVNQSMCYQWREVDASIAPNGTGPAAFDKSDAEVVVYAYNASSANCSAGFSTWVLNLQNRSWTRTQSEPNMSGRLDAGMAQDPGGGVLLFGGLGCNGQLLNETWSYVGGHWSRIEPLEAPPARMCPSMSEVDNGSGILLYGGVGRSSTGGLVALSDTWLYESGSWARLQSVPGPPGLDCAGMAMDPYSGRAVLFGGATSASDSCNNSGSIGISGETWLWTHSSGWAPGSVQGARDTLPSPRLGPAIGSGESNGVMMFGGRDTNGSLLNDTWFFDGVHWSQVPVSENPSARACGQLVVGTLNGDEEYLLFGGDGVRGPLSDTWYLVPPQTIP